jgi:hypothetical protein
MNVVGDSHETYDYDVQVLVTGIAPKKPEPLLAKAAAKVSFTLREDAAAQGVFRAVDEKAAAAGFVSVANDCALRDAELAAFAGSSVQQMTPDFDIVALTGDAVDNVVGCVELARFFVEAKNRYPKAPAASAR